ncbi:hypothetical protein [Gracilimonas sp.]|uniref:hypothetical protein n=1 Tax=Gracilimonas sp. TaxID=1974203 RepID=UPI0032EEB407
MKMNERSLKFYLALFVLALIGVVPNKFAIAQNVTLDVEPSPILESAQTLSLTGLGIDTEGQGPVLISATMENLSDVNIDNLYFELIVSAGKVGNIVELTQNASRPFSLKPFQSVYFTNNDLANERIPGISQAITFTGGLTTEGDDFLSNLSGSTTLPRDTYSLELILFRVTDAQGREDLARDVAEIGGGSMAAASFEEGNIYLKTPGDIVGAAAEITNPFPQFSWEGENNVSYRLLVVEQRGQDSPESLLASAKSSSPVGNGGSLLTFENLDIVVQSNSFQFPSSGVQPLEKGKTYYWQVVTTLQSSGDTEEVSSEIWSFVLKDAAEAVATAPISAEVQRAIERLIGPDAYRRLRDRGFTLESIQYDGQDFTGPAAAIKLEELLQKIRDEKIIVEGN